MSLGGACTPGGQFTLHPLVHGEPWYYGGPKSPEAATSCVCNTVYFNMLSACALCQGGTSEEWSTHVVNCPTSMTSHREFPRPIPSDVSVPGWAYLDVKQDRLDINQAQSFVGPESSAPPSPTPSPENGSQDRGKSRVGTISGAAVGGVIGLTLFLALTLYFTRRRRHNKDAAFSEPTTTLPQDGTDSQRMPEKQAGSNSQVCRAAEDGSDGPGRYASQDGSDSQVRYANQDGSEGIWGGTRTQTQGLHG